MKPIAKLSSMALILAAIATPVWGQQSIVGAWADGRESGNVMTFTFRDDGTGSWHVETAGAQPFSDTFEFHYSVAYDADPTGVDIFEVDHGPLVGQVLFGVVRFAGDSAISLDFEVGSPGDDSVRPVDFSGGSVVLLERTSEW